MDLDLRSFSRNFEIVESDILNNEQNLSVKKSSESFSKNDFLEYKLENTQILKFLITPSHLHDIRPIFINNSQKYYNR